MVPYNHFKPFVGFFVLFHVTKANLVHQENEFTVIEMCAQLFRKYFYP